MLHQFVTAHREEIILRCRAKVASRFVPLPTAVEIDHGVPMFLDQLVERVPIEVEDECGGLPTGNANDLFRPFEQRSTDRTGAGLGLAFSRWAAEANGGRISTRNLPDRECVFALDLPRSQVAATPGV